ncbi:MAG: tryptophan synthase subunit alpha [Lachnospiraceae bacterium]|nr:tryptophan synthase subunit alpha [Lachnospiraceae bacterium]
MTRIHKAFENGKAFIAFLTGGDPDLETTEQLIYAIEEAGADLIEIGIPFSDPIAEGVVIQEADERAMKNGTTTDDLFALVKKVRQNTQIPLVFMTYYNPVFSYGRDKFMQNAAEAGIDGLIIPDVPFEESEEVRTYTKQYGLELINMIAPTSIERTKMIAEKSEGFLYCVSSLGVTGVRSEINTNIANLIKDAKEVTDVPCAIGFGISTPQQAKEMASFSDGVIVGSAIVRIIAEHGKDAVPFVKEYVKSMKDAIR